MIVISCNKENNDFYLIKLSNDKEYKLSIETVLEYRLVKGKEITEVELENAILNDLVNIWYNKALDYALKYNKTSFDTFKYLTEKKEVDNDIAFKVVEKLKDKNIIDDYKIALNKIYALANNGNGKLLIEQKLKNLGYPKNIIDKAMTNIDLDSYYEGLEKMYIKAKKNYEKEENEYIRKQKIIKYLLSRGYYLNEIKEFMD